MGYDGVEGGWDGGIRSLVCALSALVAGFHPADSTLEHDQVLDSPCLIVSSSNVCHNLFYPTSSFVTTHKPLHLVQQHPTLPP